MGLNLGLFFITTCDKLTCLIKELFDFIAVNLVALIRELYSTLSTKFTSYGIDWPWFVNFMFAGMTDKIVMLPMYSRDKLKFFICNWWKLVSFYSTPYSV